MLDTAGPVAKAVGISLADQARILESNGYSLSYTKSSTTREIDGSTGANLIFPAGCSQFPCSGTVTTRCSCGRHDADAVVGAIEQ